MSSLSGKQPVNDKRETKIDVPAKEPLQETKSPILDNRPETIQQSNIQTKADNSIHSLPIAQLQHKANQFSNKSTIQKKGNQTGLPDELKSGIENLSGFSMDDVRVHYNSNRPAQLNAHAYAQGTDIHLASGQEKHLPHEAWHVVQQKQGRVKPTMQMKGSIKINDDTGLEREADQMGQQALNAEISSSNTLQRKSSNNQVIQRKTNDLPEYFKNDYGDFRGYGDDWKMNKLVNQYNAIDQDDNFAYAAQERDLFNIQELEEGAFNALKEGIENKTQEKKEEKEALVKENEQINRQLLKLKLSDKHYLTQGDSYINVEEEKRKLGTKITSNELQIEQLNYGIEGLIHLLQNIFLVNKANFK